MMFFLQRLDDFDKKNGTKSFAAMVRTTVTATDVGNFVIEFAKYHNWNTTVVAGNIKYVSYTLT